jgi:hypothetical protein
MKSGGAPDFAHGLANDLDIANNCILSLRFFLKGLSRNPPSWLVLMRYVNFDVASGNRGVHGCHNPLNVALDGRPLRIAKNDDGQTTALQILLVANIFVRRKQNVEASFFSRLEKFAV